MEARHPVSSDRRLCAVPVDVRTSSTGRLTGGGVSPIIAPTCPEEVRMFLRDTRILLSLGMIFLAVAILLKRFGGQSGVLAFIEGLLIGLSLVLNITYLILIRRERDSR
jgi:hypothetical protein